MHMECPSLPVQSNVLYTLSLQNYMVNNFPVIEIETGMNDAHVEGSMFHPLGLIIVIYVIID